MACDICGSTKGELSRLQECYQSDGISHVCAGCLKVLNDHQSKLRDVTHNILVAWLRRFIAERRAAFKSTVSDY